jgi:hypothetical protein
MVANEVLVKGIQECLLSCFDDGARLGASRIVYENVNGIFLNMLFNNSFHCGRITEIGDKIMVILAESYIKIVQGFFQGFFIARYQCTVSAEQSQFFRYC